MWCISCQLCQYPRWGDLNEATEDHLQKEILDSDQRMPLEQVAICPARGWTMMESSWPSWPKPQTQFSAMNHDNYRRPMARRDESCEEVLAVVRDAHWQVLAALALLEDKIERLRCSFSHRHSGTCKHSGSCWHSGGQRRSWTVDSQARVFQGASCHGQAQSPSPFWSGWWVTFTHSLPESSPRRDTATNEAHRLLLPTWGDGRAPGD